MSDQTDGEIAYAAYCKNSGGPSRSGISVLPAWTDLPAVIREAWEEAAEAVIRAWLPRDRKAIRREELAGQALGSVADMLRFGQPVDHVALLAVDLADALIARLDRDLTAEGAENAETEH